MDVYWGTAQGVGLPGGEGWAVSVLGGVCLGVRGGGLPPPCGQTDACENVILPQTSFAGGKNVLGIDGCS